MQDWLQLFITVAAIIIGGAIGAIITWIFTRLQNAHQPIDYSVDVFPLLNLDTSIPLRLAQITPEGHRWLDNVGLFRLIVSNNGNADIARFTFAINLTNTSCILVETFSSDIQHNVIIHSEVSPENPKYEIVITLSPFNRRDKYTIQVYAASFHFHSVYDYPLQLSSAQPVVFRKRTAFKSPAQKYVTAAIVLMFISGIIIFGVIMSFYVNVPRKPVEPSSYVLFSVVMLIFISIALLAFSEDKR